MLGAAVRCRAAAGQHAERKMVRRRARSRDTASAMHWSQLDLQVWRQPGRRGVLVIVFVLVVEGTHGAGLRADGGVVAASLPPPLPRVLPPSVHGFSDPVGYQGSLVL
jgi:hypothetical protein